ncbi:homeobox domain-containing protein [Caerostris darwini]|uniref:Homeobox domain-containing protein n=1 Tax=Caerostris darwini TaxID=1538125 RepID=A0AAV4SNQ7_9ARAC|nr:homeobox domain-containing protein [Caerostris darwini]
MGTPFGLCAPLPISAGAHARRVEGGRGVDGRAAEVMLPLSRFPLTLTETNGAHQKPFTELPRPIWYHVVVVFSPRPHPHVPSPGGMCHTISCLPFFSLLDSQSGYGPFSKNAGLTMVDTHCN